MSNSLPATAIDLLRRYVASDEEWLDEKAREKSKLYRSARELIDAYPSTAAKADAGEWQPLTDEDRDRAFNRLDGGLTGFMKLWGWLHYAKAIEEMCREKNTPKGQP